MNCAGGERPVVTLSAERFEELVADALDEVPPRLMALLDNVVILVEAVDEHDPQLLGVYDGVALPDRDSDYSFALPDRILIFREPLLAMCEDEEELREEVTITVVHEIAHHFGIDDRALHELGWG
jgi:predicted Zn-dependent protease with MMP-like domain